MCGFAGIVTWDEGFRIQRATLEAMSAAVAHRGPDGEGLWLNHEEMISVEHPQCGLVHRRLAVIDPDPRANQPFTDGRRWVVFNGEIYNFRELKKEISASRPEQAWRTTCDTEVLLAAYDLWGTDCVEHLNGMFAFAIWDPQEKHLYLARDRMGQKPLYFTFSPEKTAVAFASELSALLAVPWFDRRVNYFAVGLYLNWGYINAPATIYDNASKLEAATWLRIGHKELWKTHFYDPNQPLQTAGSMQLPGESAVQATRRFVDQAVRRQLVADVPLGCFLSGGVDSSIVAAAMKSAAGKDQQVRTFSIGFDDPRYNETRYAANVAAHLGTKHEQFIVRPDVAADLPRLAEVYGEPFGDSSALPTHYLARETRKFVTVALSGDGGDELFGGYDRYRAMALGEKVDRMPAWVQNLLRSGMWQMLPGTHPKSRLTRLKRFLASLKSRPAERYAQYMALFDNPSIDQLTGTRTVAVPVDARDVRSGPERDVVQMALATDRVMYLPEDLLTKLDRASMLHALEVRSPFMDHELVHFASTLTTDQLLGGGPKRMLREAFGADLPAEVFRRPKMGFALPIGEWFRDELRDLLRDAVTGHGSFARKNFQYKAVETMLDEHDQGLADHSQRLYALLMLELWWQRFGQTKSTTLARR